MMYQIKLQIFLTRIFWHFSVPKARFRILSSYFDYLMRIILVCLDTL